MIQGLTALLPIINKAVDLVPDKNKVAQHKADLERISQALVDVDKEQAKINREDAKATGALSWIQRLWRPTLACMCVCFSPVLSYTYNKLGMCFERPTIDLPTLDSSTS